MKFPPLLGRLGATVCGLGLILPGLIPGYVEAQKAGTLEGIVVEASTGQSLEGVEVQIVGTDLQASTGEDGTFRFPGILAGPVDVRARLEGYVTFTDRVRIPENRIFHLEVRLETVAAVLEELLIVAERRPRADTLGDLPSGTNPLEGEPSVTIFRSSQVGGNSTFLIRGLKTFTGKNTPAIFVDGVQVFDFDPRNRSRTGGPGILDLIPLETIDSVRVIRGPSAAPSYGPETANGVILIFTKRGQGSGGG